MRTINLPGAFDSWFSGTGVAQGNTGEDNSLVLLAEAYRAAVRIKRGRGYSLRLSLPENAEEREDLLHALRDYADYCLVANSDEPNHSEVAAARKVYQEATNLLAH